jgi:hypothetical protein
MARRRQLAAPIIAFGALHADAGLLVVAILPVAAARRLRANVFRRLGLGWFRLGFGRLGLRLGRFGCRGRCGLGCGTRLWRALVAAYTEECQHSAGCGRGKHLDGRPSRLGGAQQLGECVEVPNVHESAPVRWTARGTEWGDARSNGINMGVGSGSVESSETAEQYGFGLVKSQLGVARIAARQG